MTNDLQRVATGRTNERKLPHGYRTAYEVHAKYQRYIYRWKGVDDLERAVNWHYTPSYFVDRNFFSTAGHMWVTKENPSKQKPRSLRDQRDRAAQLQSRDAYIQRYVVSEAQKALKGLSAFMFRRLLHDNIESLKILSHRPEEALSDLSPVAKHMILADHEKLRAFTLAGPATLTQAHIRHALLAMTDVSPLFCDDGKGMVVIPSTKVQAECAVHEELDNMSGLVRRATGERVRRLAEECVRISRQSQSAPIKKEFLASHLGVDDNTTSFRKVWKAYQEILTQTSEIRLQGAGRPRKERN